ncbi:hypothetical protein BKA67DRAFT_530469 [Truncatella angustata]|uniref:Uncharacterized protein n=1 Tax=Truncatella angustata TaxID=152316 RepID=A0A9P8UXV2_9PEZI|nr:uncharacterized protein BKA67DRAFT_530469 [Truncatella angustata]KAH6660370.1 hypothetical protein BKA67DRAFT_530469 [Truncatella angustata]
MYAHQLIVFYAGGLATCVHASGLLLRGHQVRQDTPTPCTSNAVETVATINRGNEGIWHVKANQTGVNELYQFTQTDWLGNNKTAVLNECTSICLTGNSAETPGTWLPSGKYFQGAFINTPGGSSQHPVWMCACYTNTLSMANLVAGGGVASNLDNGFNKHLLIDSQWDNGYGIFEDLCHCLLSLISMEFPHFLIPFLGEEEERVREKERG